MTLIQRLCLSYFRKYFPSFINYRSLVGWIPGKEIDITFCAIDFFIWKIGIKSVKNVDSGDSKILVQLE